MSDDTPVRPRRGLPAPGLTDGAAGTPGTPANIPEDSAPMSRRRPRRGAPDSSLPEPADAAGSVSPAPRAASPEPASSSPRHGDAVPAEHALFLPPDVEGSLSNTWTMRAIRDDDTPESTRAPEAPARQEPAAPEEDAAEGQASDEPTPEESAPRTTRPAAPALSPLRRLLPWSVLGLVGAIVVGSIVLVTTRPHPVSVASSPSAAGSASSAMVSTADLLSPGSATQIADATWNISRTQTSLDSTSDTVACFTQHSGVAAPTGTAQRTLSSDSPAGLAALHRIDGYATAAQATAAFAANRTDLGTCDAVPMFLVAADSVSGLGDDALSVVVADQESKATTFHTVLMVRTGRVVDTYDVAQNTTSVPVTSVVKAATQTISQQCSKAGGSCSATPTVTASAPPTGDPTGWLGLADLPRVTPGQGSWTTTDPGTVSNTSTQCEGVTLGSVAGPVSRQQRTYLLTQDSLAPTSFGLDQINFLFPSASGAKAFATQLAGNLSTCSKTMATATVSQNKAFSVSAQDSGVGDIQGTAMLIEEKTGATTSAWYRVAVVQRDNVVTYLMSNPTRTFGFDAGEMQEIAVRAAQRTAEK